MARYSRKYVFDKTQQKVVLLPQEPEVAATCEAIAATTNPFKRELFADDSVPGKSTRHIAKWPIVSMSAGIDPEDVPIEQAYLAQHGVKTEYINGDPVFRDRKHRHDHLKAISEFHKANGGFAIVDRDGGWSDYTG